MKTYGGVDVFLTSAIIGGEWLASSPDHKEPRYPLDRRLNEP
jgi:hypothetical protein